MSPPDAERGPRQGPVQIDPLASDTDHREGTQRVKAADVAADEWSRRCLARAAVAA